MSCAPPRAQPTGFCGRPGVRRIAVVGSALGDELEAASELDLLVQFQPDRVPVMFRVAEMELELETAG